MLFCSSANSFHIQANFNDFAKTLILGVHNGKSQAKDCQSEKRGKWLSAFRGKQAERPGG